MKLLGKYAPVPALSSNSADNLDLIEFGELTP